ncbi:hypothetical protein JTB14_029318 [Gonioctena quinquepunctata]|nr:hypothetical protein JTB14_029318 [Gonioctena quinquepunctata]
MEKEAPESMTTVNMKPEYAPSEGYPASEPPPAYHRHSSTNVHITKIVAVTIVICSVVLGSFWLASAYVTSNASCRHLEQELELLGEAADRFQSPPQPEALIQEYPLPAKRQVELLNTDEPPKNTKEIETNSIDDAEASSETPDSSESEENEKEIHLRLPVQMELEDVIGSLLEKNQKSKMNCIVEKKKSEEFVDHRPKTITLPFGLNLTTNPRFEKLSGERMVIICESGTVQRSQPPPQEDDDEEEDTIMIQPVMIPIPQTPFRTHMPQQMRPMVQNVPEQMRQPMRPPMYQMENLRPPMVQQMMPPMFQQQAQQQVQPMFAQRMVPPQVPQQVQQYPRVQMQIQLRPQMPPQDQQEQQSGMPPNPILQHIVQQIIAQKIMESQRAREEQMKEEQAQQQQQPQVEVEEERPHRFHAPQVPQIPQNLVGQRIPIPEEVLTQLNRLPNRDVIVAVSESDSDAEEAPQDIRFVQEQRQGASEMNGRQTLARGLPVDIPIAMMPQEQEPQEHQQEAAASEETRPHYVQPRSV